LPELDSSAAAQRQLIVAPEWQPPPQVQLLDPGREPRQVLRHAALTEPETMTDTTVTEVNRRILGDATLGAIHGKTRITTTLRLTPLAAGQLEIVVQDVTGEAQQDGMSDAAQVLEPSLAAVRSRHLVLNFDERCQLSKLAHLGELPRDRTQAGALVTLWLTVRHLCAPLPAEPVGVGARWSVTYQDRYYGRNMQVQEVYTLERVEGRTFSASFTAERGDWETPEADRQSRDQGHRVSSPSAKGTGFVQVDLDHYVAKRSLTFVSDEHNTLSRDGVSVAYDERRTYRQDFAPLAP